MQGYDKCVVVKNAIQWGNAMPLAAKSVLLPYSMCSRIRSLLCTFAEEELNFSFAFFQELYTWDKGNQLTYPIRYHEIGYNISKEEKEPESNLVNRTDVEINTE